MTSVRTAAQDVTLRQLPTALRGLWKVCAATEPDTNVMRSLAINLVAVTTADREAEQGALLDQLVQRLPCRAFVVVIDDAAGEVTARVEGAMRRHRHTQEIVLEQIELRGAWQALPQVLGIVRPLLVNDLSTHFYWATDWPAAPTAFDAFAALCDHAVVDSAAFRAPAPGIGQLQQRRDRGACITDLTWLRLRPWRRALAEAFERFAFRAEEPTAATIASPGSTGAWAAALLLGRWLEQKLGARIVMDDAAEGPVHDLAAVQLHHGDVEVQVAHDRRGDLVVQVTTAASCFLPFAMPAWRGGTADLLAAAIDQF